MSKRLFILSDAEIQQVLAASKPTPAIYLSGGKPMFDSPQENANRAWKDLARVHGFVWDSVEPIPGKPTTHILAEPIPPSEPVADAISEANLKEKL